MHGTRIAAILILVASACVLAWAVWLHYSSKDD